MTAADPARLGSRIRRLRLQRGLSQREVAEPDMSSAYLSLIESGQRAPSPKALGHIAARLEVDLDELVLGTPTGLRTQLELKLQEARAAAYRGRTEEARADLDAIRKAASRYRFTQLLARTLVVLAGLRENAGEFGEARALFDEARVLLREEPAHNRFEAEVGFARCTHYLDGPRLAVHLLETYLLELEQAGLDDPRARMRTLSALVQMYHAVGFERRAAEVAEEALRLKPEVDDPEQIACMSMNVARSLLDQGRHDDALAALRDAEQVYQSLDWPLPRARSQINRGIVQVSKGNLEGARGTFSEALEVLSEHPSEQADRAAVLNQLGRVHRLLGDLEQAKAYLKEARASIPDEDPFEAALNARELGLVLAASDHGSAQRELRKSADLFRSAGASDEAAAALLELGRMLKGTGQMDDAVKILEEGLELTASSAD